MPKNPTPTDEPQAIPPGFTLRATLQGPQHHINSLVWTPDGRYLLAASEDWSVYIWELTTGRLLFTLRGHLRQVSALVVTPDGKRVVTASHDRTVRVWNLETGRLIRTLEGHLDVVFSVTVTPDGCHIISASKDRKVRIWDLETGYLIGELSEKPTGVTSISITPDGRKILSVSAWDDGIRIWDFEWGHLVRTLNGHFGAVFSVIATSDGQLAVSGSSDRTVRVWNLETGRLVRTLEGHSARVFALSLSSNGEWLASDSEDKTVRIWKFNTGQFVALLPSSEPKNACDKRVVFHPIEPALALVGGYDGQEIIVWDLDYEVLRRQAGLSKDCSYRNAKVVLVGDSGVGKSGLGLVLNNQPFKETTSTHGRFVWSLDSRNVEVDNGQEQTRETLLWDLAGQPGYRVIHQLHLHEVCVALVVFDGRSETDPLSGVRHWERALRLAKQRQGDSAPPLIKFLVSARNDRGGVSVSKERLDAVVKEFGFDGYFETSAQEGWKIKELRAAIEAGIPWDELPVVSSSVLFAQIKEFLLEAKKTGRLLVPAEELYLQFTRAHPDIAERETNLRAQFDTCISRLENRDLIRRLSFGGYVLLQPELLDAYASAMVNQAKNEPDGLGSLHQDDAVQGRFFVPAEHKVKEAAQEQILLHATIEELLERELVLKENADDGSYFVFPSQFNRDYEDAPDPEGKTLSLTFDGPVQSLYATLVVRLGHSGLFTTGRSEMWRNAAIFNARAGGRCGLFLQEFAEARGRLTLFYDKASDETQFNFEEFIAAHAKRKALDNSIEIVRFFVCRECGDAVPPNYVKRLRDKGEWEFSCPCGGKVSLMQPQERLQFPSKLGQMEKSADRKRDLEAFIESAHGEMDTPDFQRWAGGPKVTLAIVFTDVVGSTALENEIGGERMSDTRRAHFEQSRRLIKETKGREIKTNGDGFMVAFKCVDEALDYALALHKEPGAAIQIRAGIHIGSMKVEDRDVYGSSVNYAARVVGAIKGAEIWISEQAKADLDSERPVRHQKLSWSPQEVTEEKMKGFTGTFRLWRLEA